MNKNIAVILLAAYLILVGLAAVMGLKFQGSDIIIGVLALAAGALLLAPGYSLPGGMGAKLLGGYLLLLGLSEIFSLNFAGMDVLMGILALVTGILLLADQ